MVLTWAYRRIRDHYILNGLKKSEIGREIILINFKVYNQHLIYFYENAENCHTTSGARFITSGDGSERVCHHQCRSG
ncbi:hypothetical protein MARINOS108_11113 [Marinoscillum sp. 108]|nr:hypothetical protein MARINOS108_11113 [Marinoscillum sp. 108]